MNSVKMASLGRDARANRLIILLLSVGFLALLATAAAAFWVQRQNEEDARMVAHTLAVEASLGSFASANERMETARRGLLLTGNPLFTDLVSQSERAARSQLGELDKLIADNPEQKTRVHRLRALLDAYSGNYRKSVGLSGAARERMLADFTNDAAVANVRAARDVVSEMVNDELALLRAREANQKRTQGLFSAILIATGLLILIVAAITLWLVRRNLVELRESREELHSLNLGLEYLVDARTSELQRANNEIQRFAYIVSHDLRSPLVNVMGFTAELETARKGNRRLSGEERCRGLAGARQRHAPRDRRGFARIDRLHSQFDAEDGPADQCYPQPVAAGPAYAYSRGARSDLRRPRHYREPAAPDRRNRHEG